MVKALTETQSTDASQGTSLTDLVLSSPINWLTSKDTACLPLPALWHQYPETTPHHNRFTALFPGPPWWAGARRELLDFMVQGEINFNRGRQTHHPAGHHSIQTNQCPPPPSPHIFLRARCPSCCPTNSVKALKANQYPESTALNTVLLPLPRRLCSCRCLSVCSVSNFAQKLLNGLA